MGLTNYITRVIKLALLVVTATAYGSQPSQSSPETHKDVGKIDSLVDSRYYPDLTDFEEKRLLDLADEGDSHIYRFLCFPSFAPAVSVRLSINDVGAGTIFLKRMGRVWRQSRKPQLRLSTQHELGVQEVSRYLAWIRSMDFWNLQPRLDSVPGTDGSTWVLEGVSNGDYHAVSRWSPEPGIFRSAALLLMNYAGLDACETRGLLGQHELNKLEYLGFLVTGKPPKKSAVVKTPDGLMERVKVGNFMGTRDGRITKITEDYVQVRELIPDRQRGYLEKTNRLYRKKLKITP